MIVPADIMEQMVAHAEKDAPIEACGLLFGADGRIVRRLQMTNADKKEDHFTFDPEEQWAAYKFAEKEGLDIIGVYHSHPAHPALPSPEDIRLAYDPNLLYVIVSLMEGKRTVRGFYIEDGKVREELLIIGKNEAGPSLVA
jgi:[CysO sulfur-carrier protein]-S-L-cysteine hydrolase